MNAAELIAALAPRAGSSMRPEVRRQALEELQRVFASSPARPPAWFDHELRRAGLQSEQVPVPVAKGLGWIALDDDEGERLWREQQQRGPLATALARLCKGKAHKYIARFPTGNPKRPWRYVYRYRGASPNSVLVESPLDSNKVLQVGAAIADSPVGEHGGHWVVTASHDDGTMTVRHDETHEERRVSRNTYNEFFRDLRDKHWKPREAEIERRVSMRNREMHESLDVLDAIVAAPPTRKSLKDLHRQVSLLSRRYPDHEVERALRTRLGVSSLPKSHSELIREIHLLHGYAEGVGVHNLDHALEGLAFDKEGLKRILRMRFLHAYINERHDDDQATDFVAGLPRFSLDQAPKEIDSIVAVALRGPKKRRLGSVKFVPFLRETLETRWADLQMSPGARKHEWILLKAELDKRRIAYEPPWFDKPPTFETPSFVGRPEAFGDVRHASDDRVYYADAVVKRIGPLVGYDLRMRVQGRVFAQALLNDQDTEAFRADHERRMGALRGHLSDVAKALEPVMQGMAESTAAAEREDAEILEFTKRQERHPLNANDYAEMVERHRDERDLRLRLRRQEARRQIMAALGIDPGMAGINSLLLTASIVAEAMPLCESIHPLVMPSARISRVEKTGRSHCSHDNQIVLTKLADRATLWHELGHAIEHDSPAIAKAARTLLIERSKGHPLVPLQLHGFGYEPDEHTYTDKWWSPYIGKWYEGAHRRTADGKTVITTEERKEAATSTEIVSMGVEAFVHDPVAFWKRDPEHFHFTVAVLAGRLGKRGEKWA